MNYQQIFDDALLAVPDERGDYNKLVEPLEVVFKAAGYDITAKELAGAQHSHICGMIGYTDLEQIAKGFIMWVNAPRSLPYPICDIAKGEMPAIFWSQHREPKMNSHRLLSWQDNISRRIKTEKIRRNTKRYFQFLEEAALKVRSRMRQEAALTIMAYKVDLIQAVKAFDQDNAKARDMAHHLRRTAYIIQAFCDVAQVKDDQGKALILVELAAKIENGVSHRRVTVDGKMDQEFNCDEVISAGVAGYKDLKVIWQKVLEIEAAEKNNKQ